MNIDKEFVKIFFCSTINVAHVLYLIFEEKVNKNNFIFLQPTGGPPEDLHDDLPHGLHQGARNEMIFFNNQCGTCLIPNF